jgi:hypothetical protein
MSKHIIKYEGPFSRTYVKTIPIGRVRIVHNLGRAQPPGNDWEVEYLPKNKFNFSWNWCFYNSYKTEEEARSAADDLYNKKVVEEKRKIYEKKVK